MPSKAKADSITNAPANYRLSVCSKIRVTLIALILGFYSLSYAEERIWLNAKINDKPVHLCFDSGSAYNVLAPETVKKLGIKFIPAPPDDLFRGVLAGDTEECALQFDEFGGCTTTFLVLDPPGYVRANIDIDGLIGWWTLSPNILRIDAEAGKVTPLLAMPKQTAQWNQFSILALTNSGALDLQMPHNDRANGVLCIDTGGDYGLALPDNEWKRWRELHPYISITLDTFYSPSNGFYVTQEAWADEISIGPIVLRGVPIMRAGPFGATRWGEHYEGTLGLAALKRLDIIVDGKNDLAYLQAKTTRPPAFRHNRLGAVFVPTGNHTNQAIARVVEGVDPPTTQVCVMVIFFCKLAALQCKVGLLTGEVNFSCLPELS
jgi:Aspartyl protease